MRIRSSSRPLLLGLALLFVARSPRAADADAAPAASPDAHRGAVVARVGPRAITVGELEDRLSPVPRYQLRTFGSTGPAIARAFFEQILLRDILLSLGAQDRHIDQNIEVQQALDRTISGATLRALLLQMGPASAVSMEEVQRYYDANRAHYETPERIAVWRILCGTREEAQAVLTEAKKDGTLQTFSRLAREHSKDKATFLRGGNLGFLNEAGQSNEPGVSVDPALVKAAARVQDGEIVPTPVPEGTAGFAVVWRRGTTPATHRSVDEAKLQIQDALIKEKREAAEKALLDRLRAAKVKEVNEDLLGTFEVSIDDGTVKPRKRPSQEPPK